MRRSWPAHALDLLAGDKPAAMVTLTSVEGSAPREAGVRMIVSGEAVHGTVGGGNLEFLLIDQARRLIASGINFLQQDYPLGPLLAQCCGGRVRVLIERVTDDATGWLQHAHAAESAGSRYLLEARIIDGCIKRTVRLGWPTSLEAGVDLYGEDGNSAARNTPWTRMVERIAPVSARLYIFGAGHVGSAIIHIARTLPFSTSWFDSRAELVKTTPGLETRDNLVSVVEEAPPSAFFLVLTHAHELDYQLTRAILKRGDAAYCGLIGSATKRARFLSRLAKEGIDASRLTCPIGAGAIHSKDPACIAVAAACELLVKLEAAQAGVAEGLTRSA